MSPQLLSSLVEYVAVVSCGMTGGLAAIRKHYDVFATLIIAWTTALGGGLVRDVLLGAIPPVGISDKGLILAALLSGAGALVLYPEISDLRRTMIIWDALALGLFAVNGTLKGLNYGTSSVEAVFLGMATAVAGGLVRDILLNIEPAVLRDNHYYAFPSLLGCIGTVGVFRAEQWGMVSSGWASVLNIAIIALVVTLRLLSVKFDLHLPGAYHARVHIFGTAAAIL